MKKIVEATFVAVLMATMIASVAACGSSTAPTAPSSGIVSSTANDTGRLNVAPEHVSEGAASGMNMRTEAAQGSTDVPTVSKSLCSFSSSNPYPCCQNSPGQYGNCTGAAWETAMARWQGHQLPGWGNARTWTNSAIQAGYIVETTPTEGSIGINTAAPAGHVAFVTNVSGSSVTTIEQQCGAGYSGGYATKTRAASYYDGGFIRSPVPTVIMMVWNGASQATNGGTLNVKRPLFGGSVAVQFGFSLLRSNVNRGSSTYAWMVDGNVVSSGGNPSYNFTKAGTYKVSVRVTNGLNVSTTASATVVVS